jgi:molybdate transport system substrate-binding protein
MPLMSRLAVALVSVPLVLSTGGNAQTSAGSDVISVYAVTSISEALRAAIDRYPRSGTPRIALIVGQSVDFARMIETRAPANIFVSASEQLVAGLVVQGLVDPEAIASPVGNDLVLVAPVNSQLKEVLISPELDFAELLGKHGGLAVGDPDYTPIGIYAMIALSKLGQWKSVAPRLLRGSSAGAALELVESGRAALGITFSTSAATAKKVKIIGRFPHSGIPRFVYTFAIVKSNDGPETRKLFQFLIGPEALQIYAAYGFTVERKINN